MPNLPDEQLDHLLAQLGRAEIGDGPSELGPAATDELSLERLRRGELGDEDRQRLIAKLATNRALREAWIESMEERIPLEETLEGYIADAVLAQRRDEGLPDGSASRLASGHTGRWLALAAALALAIGLGTVIYGTLRPGEGLPEYQVTVSGQLATMRGGEPTPAAGIPAFAAGGTLSLTLHPAEGPRPDAVLRVAAVDPDGGVRALDQADGLQIEERDGVFHVEGSAGTLFGEHAGRWVMIAVLEPSGRRWSDARIAAEGAAAAEGASEPTSTELGGGRRLFVVPLDYTP
jgi:hypothetical protein